jgi:protein disulfide-isomerase A1
VILFGLLSTLCCIDEERGVLVLKDSTFDEAIKAHPFMMVEFYAPWCGHCKKLAPEYEAAAEVLRKENPPIFIAKVDATENKTLAGKYNVSGYPTLKLMKDGKAIDYSGGRTKDEIVQWLKKKSGPAVSTLDTVADIESFFKSFKLVMIFLGKEDKQFKEFEFYANTKDEIAFGHCEAQSCLDHYGLKTGNIVLLKEYDEKRSDFLEEVSVQALKKFVKKMALPKVLQWEDKVAKTIFQEKTPGLFLYRDAKNAADYKQLLDDVAEIFRGEIQVIETDIKKGYETNLAEYIGVSAKDLPTVRIHDTTGELKKYNMAGEINKENIVQFVNDWKNKKLKVSLKTEDIPATQDKPVYEMVGQAFPDIVGKEKDLLLYIYGPEKYCKTCKDVEPVIEKLAKKMEGNPNLIIARMEGAKNEIENLQIKDFPAIKFYKANSKKRSKLF